jgi:hypothetical protein
MYKTYRLICVVNQTITAEDNQCVVTNQIGFVIREFKIKFSALVSLLYMHYALTYPGVTSAVNLTVKPSFFFNFTHFQKQVNQTS